MSTKFRRLLALLIFIATAGPSASTTTASKAMPPGKEKLDAVLKARASRLTGRSRVIIQIAPGASANSVSALIQVAGGSSGRALPLIGGRVAELPNAALTALAGHPLVAQVSEDRPIVGAMERTGATVGATVVRSELGYDGTGVGVAVIDSGVAPAHDDLRGNGAPARRSVRRLRQRTRRRVRRLRTWHARRRHHCRQRLRFGRRPGRASRQAPA